MALMNKFKCAIHFGSLVVKCFQLKKQKTMRPSSPFGGNITGYNSSFTLYQNNTESTAKNS